jgi:hypothetical protein
MWRDTARENRDSGGLVASYITSDAQISGLCPNCAHILSERSEMSEISEGSSPTTMRMIDSIGQAEQAPLTSTLAFGEMIVHEKRATCTCTKSLSPALGLSAAALGLVLAVLLDLAWFFGQSGNGERGGRGAVEKPRLASRSRYRYRDRDRKRPISIAIPIAIARQPRTWR